MIPMTSARKIEITLFLVAVVLGAIFLKGWILEREARIRAEATQQAGAKTIAADQVAIKYRDSQAEKQSADLARQATAIVTPQQASQVIVRYLPMPQAAVGQPQVTQAPVPIVQKEDFSAAEQAKLPSAPAYGILTQQQLVDQAKNDLACQAQAGQLAACQSDKTDLAGEITAETATANAWQAAAKGGTKWQRFSHALKLVGCAGAGAGVGALAGRKSPAIGATFGAAAGVSACSIF